MPHFRNNPSAAERFVGAWNLVSWEIRFADGRIAKPFNGRFVGRVLYDRSGQMSAQIMCQDRPLFVSGSRLEGTLQEFKSAFEGYVAFFGTYVVNETDRTITHHVAGHLSPNQVGSRRVRGFQFDGDRLTLRPEPGIYAGMEAKPVLVWERMG